MKCDPMTDGVVLDAETTLERDAIDRWLEGGVAVELKPVPSSGLRITFAEPAPPEPWRPKVGDRVRCKEDGGVGDVVQVFGPGPGYCDVVFDGSGSRWTLRIDGLEPAPAPPSRTLRFPVIGAKVEFIGEGRQWVVCAVSIKASGVTVYCDRPDSPGCHFVSATPDQLEFVGEPRWCEVEVLEVGA